MHYQIMVIVWEHDVSFHSEAYAKRLEQLRLMRDNAPSSERSTTEI